MGLAFHYSVDDIAQPLLHLSSKTFRVHGTLLAFYGFAKLWVFLFHVQLSELC